MRTCCPSSSSWRAKASVTVMVGAVSAVEEGGGGPGGQAVRSPSSANRAILAVMARRRRRARPGSMGLGSTARRIVAAMPVRREVLEIVGREVVVTNPDKVFFPEIGATKLDLVRYYLAVADGALRGVAGRPMALKRFVNGAGRALLPGA